MAGADGFAASVKLSVAQRSRGGIAVGDLFYISYQVSDLDVAPEKPADVPGAKVMYFERTGQSSSMTSINGRMTQSYGYTYTMTLRATQEGTYTFGPVTVDGVKSNSVSYTIGPKTEDSTPSAQSQNRNQGGRQSGNQSDAPRFIGKGDGNLFLKAEVSQSSAYQQQAIVYVVKLYTTYDAIKFIGATAAPKFEGFVVEESSNISSSLEYETYNGKTYATAVIARYIIFPQMVGDLKVIGNTYTVSVDEREYFHDPFWGNLSRSKPLQLNVTPNDLTISVKALPQPVPEDFSGGVGNFTITSSLPEQTFLSNQAASIIYTINGTGNLKYVTLPDLNKLYPPELEVYSPSTEVNAKVGSSNVSGTVKLDYSFMPLEAGYFNIPSVSLVYFNPATGKYETSTARGYDINVSKGKESEKSQTKSKLAFNPKLMDNYGSLRLIHRPMIRGFVYWLFFIIPLAIFITIITVYKAHVKANSDLLAVQRRKASRMAAKRLKKAAICMRDKDTDRFYDEMLGALWGYLSDKLNIPLSDLNRENVSEKLADKSIPEDATNDMITLLDDCEFAKYSPAGAKADMPEIYRRGINVINTLEDSFKQLKKAES